MATLNYYYFVWLWYKVYVFDKVHYKCSFETILESYQNGRLKEGYVVSVKIKRAAVCSRAGTKIHSPENRSVQRHVAHHYVIQQ